MKRREFVRHTAAAGTVLAVAPTWTAGCRDRMLPSGASHLDLDPGWQFLRGEAAGAELSAFDDGGWMSATLPHTARIESLVTGEPDSETAQWQGTCWYRKHFDLSLETAGRKVFLNFDGAMNVADVWLNGEQLGRHMGGWLPFGFDISNRVLTSEANVVAVRLDNRDN
ncbi:MAG: beta galactosidase jelly roll domain-containing protein, partial [Gemmatimonadetes bacterium]|nr:beta galactosidase jelly roll domain-containing protein [Gemmatimonadota bacterium]